MNIEFSVKNYINSAKISFRGHLKSLDNRRTLKILTLKMKVYSIK